MSHQFSGQWAIGIAVLLGVVFLAVLLLAVLGALLTRAVERWKK